MYKRSIVFLALAACMYFNSALAQGGGGGGGFRLPALLVESDAFEDGGIIPVKYSFYNGGNPRGGTQPGFKISNAPEGTVSYAIIFHDLDVAMMGGTDDVLHWVAWNIPADKEIPEGSLPEGSVTGANTMRQNSYFGPGAPPGPRYHHYVFEFYALNTTLDLPSTASRNELLEAMSGKVVAKAAYVGRFKNPNPPPQ